MAIAVSCLDPIRGPPEQKMKARLHLWLQSYSNLLLDLRVFLAGTLGCSLH